MKTMIVSIAMLAVASSTMAHEGMHGPGAEYDLNADGGLSLKEYTAYLKDTVKDVSKAKEKFDAMDANKDGLLSSAEFIKGLPTKAK